MTVRLSSLTEAVPGLIAFTGGDPVVEDVTHDSRLAAPGVVFVAIPGERHDGHEFLSAAADAGAAAVVVERSGDVRLPTLLVDDARAAMAPLANAVHGRPDRSLTMIGVTGTNGKTTVVHLCEAVWRTAQRPAGIIGTLGARFDGTPIELGHTTPESSDLQRLLAGMRDAGVREVAMEVSSHALDLHRADAIHFATVGFTNLTRDHLDFHGTMEEYFASKARLFVPDRADRAVINIDDRHGRMLADRTSLPIMTTGIEEGADIQAMGLVHTPTGSAFDLTTPRGSVPVHLPLVGRFNVENALVAAGLLLDVGCDLEEIRAGFAALEVVRGRMQPVGADQPFSVFVDYAHTPDAVSEVLSSAREMTTARVIAVVGAGGDRDQDKRALMGAAAARNADVTIVTTDNPRSEDPVAIATEVERGALEASGSQVLVVLDRADAIATAIESALDDDVVMILGKGHERGQHIGGRVIPFDDVAVAAEAIERRGSS